jgi:hypothetical protein
MSAVHRQIAPSPSPKLDDDIERSRMPMTLISQVPQLIVVNPSRRRCAAPGNS